MSEHKPGPNYNHTTISVPRENDQTSLPPHLSAVRYQAEELSMYFMTLVQYGVPIEPAERLALAWLERRAG